jgi:hypothetical protein
LVTNADYATFFRPICDLEPLKGVLEQINTLLGSTDFLINLICLTPDRESFIDLSMSVFLRFCDLFSGFEIEHSCNSNILLVVHELSLLLLQHQILILFFLFQTTDFFFDLGELLGGFDSEECV